jgi:isopenicillin-N N-acyltransferase-like protein
LHSVIVRQILASTQLADALTPPVMAPRAGGAHYLVGDREGNIVSIETTAKRFALAYPEDGAIGHTNHYLATKLQDTEHVRAASIGGSLVRYMSLRRYFKDRSDQLTVEGLMELTRNHTSYPRSICAHGMDTETNEGRNRTVSAMVQIPADGIIHITKGCACEGSYHAVSLS